jgi:hypothetical protein
VLTYQQFKQRLMDPSVPDEEIAQYLTVDEEESGPFDPRIVIDPDQVAVDEEGEFDENAMRWANGVARVRRARRFNARLGRERLPVLVSEGDSWFQFPFLIRDVIDHLGDDHLIWSLDAAGDTAENMVNRRPEYMKGLRRQKKNRVAAFLFSAAGNDVIGEDATGRPVLTSLVKRHQPGRDAAWHLDHAALGLVVARLEKAYRKVVTTVREDPDFQSLPIVLHGYDYALPGGQDGDPRRPKWAAQDKWLGRALTERGVSDPDLQRGIVRLLIDATYDMLTGVAGDSDRTRVYVVDVRGALPQVADWADEIHPTDAGFGRVADRFRDVLNSAAVAAP